MTYTLIDLGLTGYIEAYRLQKEYLRLVKSKASDGFLILTEHRPVFTIGRSAGRGNLLISEDAAKSYGIDIVNTDRGGDITFHGPGQLIAYPILDLTAYCRDIHRYLRDLEEVIIAVLRVFGVYSRRLNGLTGVWTDEGKIASIGIAASSWVTYHGFAINANVNLGYFDMINPCGFNDIRITSMQEFFNKEIDLESLKGALVRHFCNIFNCNIEQPQQHLKI